jgi:pyruvate formate lyase activating enzyme
MIPEKGVGYCGIWRNEKGRLEGATRDRGKLSWYHDPLPTNCVADWVCPAGTGAGYPKFACSPGPEFGRKNLAVFFHACTLNCLFCQNWHFKKESLSHRTAGAEDLVADVNDLTSCICFFGGDATPQLPFAFNASRLALEKKKGKVLRICWESNGTMHKGYLDEMIRLSLESGGCIKMDLKAWDDTLHKALTGVTNRRTLENFSRAGERTRERPVPPLLVASTLLVPGYIDEDEVRQIARFIASVNPDIPYSLLGFYPHFYLSDLPLIPAQLAERCRRAALDEGLKNVRIGNEHLLA